jgi:hypothetical protein
MSTKALTTSKLIHLVKLKGSLPSSSVSFTEEDFLYFINEELDLGVVPHVMAYHEDYFLFTEEIQTTPDKNSYDIPMRAMGNKLRDITWVSGDVYYEMTRISVEDLVDKYNAFDYSYLRDFYILGDQIVIPKNLARESGKLRISYYMRPNSLVSEDNVAVVQSVNLKNGLVTVDKLPDVFSGADTFDCISGKTTFKLLGKDVVPDGLADSESLTYTFGTIRQCSYELPVIGSIPASSYIQVIDNSQGTNLVNVFWFDKTGSNTAPVVSGANIVRVDCSACVTTQDIVVAFVAAFNSTFIDARLIATANSTSVLIQNGGVGISVGGNFTVSGVNVNLLETIISEGTITIPDKLAKNDTIALPEQSAVPQIPVELHALLAQRVTMRCLESLGDVQGLQAAAAKLADMEQKTGAIIDNRVESAPIKIVPRHTTVKRNAFKKTNRGY